MFSRIILLPKAISICVILSNPIVGLEHHPDNAQLISLQNNSVFIVILLHENLNNLRHFSVWADNVLTLHIYVRLH